MNTTPFAAVSQARNVVSTSWARWKLQQEIVQAELNMGHALDLSEQYRIQARQHEVERDVLRKKLAAL